VFVSHVKKQNGKIIYSVERNQSEGKILSIFKGFFFLEYSLIIC